MVEITEVENKKEESEALIEQKRSSLSTSLELFKRSFNVYRDNFRRFIGIVMIIFLGFLALVLVSGVFYYLNRAMYQMHNPDMLDLINPLLLLLFLMSIIGIIYLGIASQAGLCLMLLNQEKKMSIREAFSRGEKYVFELFVIGLLTLLFVLLGGLFFVVPGIIAALYFSFSVLVCVDKKHTGVTAVMKSIDLVKGYWWAVFWRYFSTFGVFYIVFFVIYLELGGEETQIGQMWGAIFDLLSLIIAPLITTFAYHIYKELKEIKGWY